MTLIRLQYSEQFYPQNSYIDNFANDPVEEPQELAGWKVKLFLHVIHSFVLQTKAKQQSLHK